MLATLPTPPIENRPFMGSSRVSDRIRSRLLAAGHRYHANDNIAAFIENGEMHALHAEVESCVREMLKALVIDVENDHNTADTAKRVAKMFIREVFQGRYEHAPSITAFPNVSQLNELMVVGPIRVRSACSHHLCPIMGKVWIGVRPNASSDLIGLSKYEWEQHIKPDVLAVVMEASHFCMHWRGIKDDGALMKNVVMRGAFKDDKALRDEFYRHLI